MLMKLLKYDLKWIYKTAIAFYGLTLFFAILTRICIEVDINFFNAIGLISIPITLCLMVGTVINTVIRGWTRLTKNLYGDESYLTHTLPVAKKTIFLSKFVSIVLSNLTSLLIVLLGLFTMFYSKGTVEVLETLINENGGYKIIIPALVLVLLEFVANIEEGNTGIILGHRSNENKMVKSVFWGFILLVSTTVVILGFILIASLFSKDLMNMLFTNSMPVGTSFQRLLYGALGLYLLIDIAYYFIDVKLLQRGVNVD